MTKDNAFDILFAAAKPDAAAAAEAAALELSIDEDFVGHGTDFHPLIGDLDNLTHRLDIY